MYGSQVFVSDTSIDLIPAFTSFHNDSQLDQDIISDYITSNNSEDAHVNYDAFFYIYCGDMGKLTAFFVLENVILVFGLIFNFLVFLLVVCVPSLRRTKSNLFVGNLAFANVLVCSCVMLFNMTVKMASMPLFSCPYVTAITTLNICSCTFGRTLIAVDRYIFISDPLRYYVRITRHKVIILLILLWVTSTALGCLPLMMNLMFEEVYQFYCVIYPEIYVSFILSVAVLPPCVIVTVIYTFIFYWAHTQLTIMQQLTDYLLKLKSRISSLNDACNNGLIRLQRYSMASRMFLSMSSNPDSLESKSMAESRISIKQAVASKKLKLSPQTLNRTLEIKTSTLVDPIPKSVKIDTASQTLNSTLETRNSTLIDPIPKSDKPGYTLYKQEEKIPASRDDPSLQLYDGSAKTISDNVSSTKKTDSFSNSLYEMSPEEKWLRCEMSRHVMAAIKKYSSTYVLSPVSAIQKVIRYSEFRTLFLFILILTASVGAWIPFLVVEILHLIGPTYYNCDLKMVSLVVLYVSSLLDPYLYAYLNQSFRSPVNILFGFHDF